MKEEFRELLIIFYRNPILGKVKTRLAATLGNDYALELYKQFVAHTREVISGVNVAVDKAVYYSDFVDINDKWEDVPVQKFKQKGISLGERMLEAFSFGFSMGYKSICIIGTDCLELSSSIVDIAFTDLRNHGAVIGPARDGGYYLLGMKSLESSIFQNKNWGTDSVYEATLKDLKQAGLNYSTLPTLSDIDVEDDLPLSLKKSISAL